MKRQYGLVPVVGAVAILAAGLLLSLGEGGRSGAGAQAGQTGSNSPSAIEELAKAKKSYPRAVWTPLHFTPAIDTATNEQCLTCHQEILKAKVREVSPAGLAAADTTAWYQTLDTYAGKQETFHARHLKTPLAKEVMNLTCNFCHRGHDPREEMPGSSATTTAAALGDFTFRKTVNPSKTCLLCHGRYPQEVMTGVEGSWPEARKTIEDASSPDTQNGCLVCHNMDAGIRTVRHQVSYLKADAIEARAKKGSSDLCYGCHGGRAWYRISYPYPRHPWKDMPDEMPDWAKSRPTASDPRYALDKKTP